MKRIKLTFHPFVNIRVSRSLEEGEAIELYNKLTEAYTPNTGIFRVDIEIIDA